MCSSHSPHCVVVQSLSHVQLCDPRDCNRPNFPLPHCLLEFAQICPLSQWCHPTISSSTPPPPPALSLSQHQGLFPMSWLFESGGQSIGASASTSVLPMNIQGWFPLGFTGLILLSKWEGPQFSAPFIEYTVFTTFRVWTSKGSDRLFFILYYLFTYFWLCWVFVAVRRLSLVAAAGAITSHGGGFSCRAAWALGHVGLVVVAHRLSCSSACGIFPDQGSNRCLLPCKVDSNHWTTIEASDRLLEPGQTCCASPCCLFLGLLQFWLMTYFHERFQLLLPVSVVYRYWIRKVPQNDNTWVINV